MGCAPWVFPSVDPSTLGRKSLYLLASLEYCYILRIYNDLYCRYDMDTLLCEEGEEDRCGFDGETKQRGRGNFE